MTLEQFSDFVEHQRNKGMQPPQPILVSQQLYNQLISKETHMTQATELEKKQTASTPAQSQPKPHETFTTLDAEFDLPQPATKAPDPADLWLKADGTKLTPAEQKSVVEAYCEAAGKPVPEIISGEELLLRFYEQNKSRCDEWMKHHPPSEPFPVAEGADGKLYWMSRADRRKFAKKSKA